LHRQRCPQATQLDYGIHKSRIGERQQWVNTCKETPKITPITGLVLKQYANELDDVPNTRLDNSAQDISKGDILAWDKNFQQHLSSVSIESDMLAELVEFER